MGFFSRVWSGVKDVVGDVGGFIVDAHLTVFTAGANIWGDKAWTWFKHMLIPDMRRDREAMVNSATSTRRCVYGRTRVGGNLVYAETSGGANEYLNIIVVFTGHAITGYDEIWFNDQLAATVSGGVVTVDAAFAGFVTIELHDGTQTTASPEMLAQTHGNWTADHKLLGCAYGYFRLKYDEAKYAAGIPAVKAVLRGKPVYDPRTAMTGWSDNPALCISDYMLMSGTIGGMGCSSDEVPTDSVITAANICDQTISAADNEKRYTLNGFISLDQTPASILKPMLSAMSGQALYSGGEWTIYAGAPAATVATLDESWLNGGISFSTGSNKGDLINTAKGTFTNPADHWADTEFPTVINEAYLSADYEELTADLPMPFTTSQTMAQRLATIEIEKSRRGMVVNYPCNLKAAHLDVMDCVAINNERLGWAGKLFRIMSWGFSPTGGIDLALVEDDAGIWGDPLTYGDLMPPPLTNLPDPWAVDNPTGLTVVESLHIGNVPSVIMAMATFSWTAGGASSRVFDVFLDGAIYATNYTDTTIDMPNMSTGLHSFAVRASNSLGTQSDTISVSATLYGKSLPPANVTGFSGTFTRGQMLLTWLPTGDLDISGYEIQIGTVWDDAVNVKLIQDYSGTSYPWTPTAPGDITLLIKAIDTSGNYSITAASVTVAVPIPVQVAFSAIAEELYATNTPGDIKSKAVVSWSGGGANVAGYDVEIWGPTESAWSPQGNVTTPTFTIYDVTPGYWKIQVRAVNDYGLAGPWMETQATLLGKTAPPSSVTGLQAEISSGQMRIYWDANPELDVSSYEIQIGTTWDGVGNVHLIQQYSGTSYLWTPNSSGTITILAKAIDTTGNFSVNAASAVYTVVAPAAVSNLTQNVIDNIVDLRWSPATMGTFPVSYYELSKGNTFATAELIGRIYSTFNILSETAAGSYKYWVVAVDTVGLRSAETGVYTVVSQPPDYILVDNQNLVLSSCTLSNAVLENDALILPVNTSITFANHFISNPDTTLEPWATPQDQINDGYPVYAQPGPTASSITKIVDYGTLLPPANITMNVTRNTVAGNPVITPEMFISPDGVTYTSLGSGLYSVMAPAAFRYVKYVLAVGSAANDGALIQVTGINVKLDVKQRSSTTTVDVTDTVSDGTQVLFSSLQIAPVDVIGISANAPYYGNANDPVTALINFVDTPYPSSFKVLAWNKAGTRISAADVVVTVKYI